MIVGAHVHITEGFESNGGFEQVVEFAAILRLTRREERTAISRCAELSSLRLIRQKETTLDILKVVTTTNHDFPQAACCAILFQIRSIAHVHHLSM